MIRLLLWLALGLGISPFRSADDDVLGPRPGGPGGSPLAVPNGPATEIDARCEAGYQAGAVVPLGTGLELHILRHGRVLALCVEMPDSAPARMHAYLTARGQATPIDVHASTQPGQDGELQVDLTHLGSEPWKLMVEVQQDAPESTDPTRPGATESGTELTYPPDARYDAPRTWSNWRILASEP